MTTDYWNGAPTPEYRTHHDVARRDASPGHRKKGRLEQLFRRKDITEEQYDAAERYGRAYDLGVVRPTSSSMFRIGSRSTGSSSPTEAALDYTRTVREADAYVQAEHVGFKQAFKLGPTAVLVRICHDDLSFAELARQMGVNDEPGRVQVVVLINTLTRYFREADRKRGGSEAPGTRAQILARLDPEAPTA